ncbi:imidazolonepropionase [Rhodopseudomonas julia]|uniref:Imidazolonepropionase n=1 Tax=Rhodopseudomonas julia TaxID=200617 RepID=A0ABU0C5J7_9BRAD|nr:imidazolonepropionase [Rhodopseudomonas julia]MDQ0325765.1 imidazolonepropionase [Rhodopseudomonas julia]
MAEPVDRLWRNARIATLEPGSGAESGDGALGIIEGGALAAKDGKIVFVGRESEMPTVAAQETFDCEGRFILPGLIDCHTHLVHGGNRAAEWEMRLKGESYEAIAKAGGGIVSTVSATRAASEDDLVQSALPRLDTLLAEGVTTIEVKSGYGLNPDDEVKMLRAAGRLAELRDVDVVRTFLGAHALPPEAEGDKDAYISQVCEQQLPQVAAEKLADAVDGFCEGIAFSPEQIAKVFAAAKGFGLPLRLHAEQLSDLGGAALAASYGALSADHLEYLGDDGIAAMAKAGTVAVLLPGAYYFLREKQSPPVAALRKAGVPIAIATDCNPGTSPMTSLTLTMNMACTLFRLTPEEAIAGVTREAAKALGRAARIGTLAEGKDCDLAIFDIEHPAELAYRIGFNPLWQRVRQGR